MQTLPQRARFFIGLIFLIGLLAVPAAFRFPISDKPGKVWEIALVIALGVLAGRTKVRLIPGRTREDRGSLTLSFALIFATLLRFGPGPAMLVGGFSTLASCFYPKRQALHQVLFNLGLSAFATYSAGWIFIHVNHGLYVPLSNGLNQEEIFKLFKAVMGSCLSFFLLNTFAVAAIINLTNDQPILETWRENFWLLAPSYFASASAGTLAIVILGSDVGPVLLFVTPVAVLIYVAYTLSARGAEESQQRIQELQTHEAQLAEELRREHLIAETLQRSLLFPLAEDSFAGLLVQTAYQPAWNEALVGGDFHDALWLPGKKVALVVGDVTGKGLAAATYMAQVKFALRAILHECPEPTAALSRLNRFLLQDQPDGSGTPLVAVALAIVDPQTGDAAVSSAGAEHPLLLRADGTTEAVRAGGMLLGTLPDAYYEAAALRLEPGDSLLMVTDGLTEARREADFFGYNGLIRAAHEAQAARSTNIGQAIIAEAKRFTGGTMHDDVCLLLVRRNPPRSLPSAVFFSPGESVVSGE